MDQAMEQKDLHALGGTGDQGGCVADRRSCAFARDHD